MEERGSSKLVHSSSMQVLCGEALLWPHSRVSVYVLLSASAVVTWFLTANSRY